MKPRRRRIQERKPFCRSNQTKIPDLSWMSCLTTFTKKRKKLQLLKHHCLRQHPNRRLLLLLQQRTRHR